MVESCWIPIKGILHFISMKSAGQRSRVSTEPGVPWRFSVPPAVGSWSCVACDGEITTLPSSRRGHGDGRKVEPLWVGIFFENESPKKSGELWSFVQTYICGLLWISIYIVLFIFLQLIFYECYIDIYIYIYTDIYIYTCMVMYIIYYILYIIIYI